VKSLRKFAAGDDLNYFSSRFRVKRFKTFLDFLKKTKMESPKIIDIGGTCNYWELMNMHFHKNFKPIVVNFSKDCLKHDNCTGIRGDGKSLSFLKDNTFDIAYSNSMIEHLSSLKEQSEMARNINRIAENYFLQTPAFVFPLEPHFLFPFFHWLPKNIRIWLVFHFNLGWFERCKNQIEAENLVDSIRIMKKKELKLIFVNAKIITERFFLIPKSYIVMNI